MIYVNRLKSTLITKLGLPVHELSRSIAEEISISPVTTIGVTGPSCVGKSAFAGMLGNELAKKGKSSSIIEVDSYLRQELRGKNQFRKRQRWPLKPENFDFEELSSSVNRLKKGEKVIHLAYERGIGWQHQRVVNPADFIVVEGLFLDSIPAVSHLHIEVGFSLFASTEIIAMWRRNRDAEVLRGHAHRFRTVNETEDEIKRALTAFTAYKRTTTSREVWIHLEFSRNREVKRIT